MLFIIGIGLNDAKDITVRGLEAVRKCNVVFLESYTSVLVDPRGLEELYGKPVLSADREFVEGEDVVEKIVRRAKTEDVAFLVVGDPFGATTHADLVLRARRESVQVEVIHNAGIMNAVGCAGLQLYSYGQAVSLCFWTDSWQPDSWYDRVASNRAAGAHTLCLLDIKTREQSIENLCRGRKIYEPPRFMTCAQAVSQLLAVEDRRRGGAFSAETEVVCLARVGSPSQKIVFGKLSALTGIDMGPPLHCLVIPGRVHPLELEFLSQFRL